MKSFLKEIEILTSKYMAEAGIDYSRKEKGEVGFTKTDGSEDHIQAIIKEYAAAKGIKLPEAKKIFDDKIAERKANMEKAPLLNGTMMENMAESAAFEMLEDIPSEDVKFEKRVFQSIFDEVKTDFPEFYPLSNAFEPKRIEPTLWYTPDKVDKRFDGVNTAACTPTAELAFNIPFMERLMKFAKVKGIKADGTKVHGKKYVSQGGPIPDEYLYCEFVLMHEIMHYANADFYFEKKFKLKGHIVNYLGDFITNYNLIKSGYSQLPMGLFSEEFNYDNHNSYRKMYDMIEEELSKLPPDQRNRVKSQMSNDGDDMPEDGEGHDPDEKQDGEPQQGEPQQGKPKPGQGEPKPGEGEPKPGEGEPKPGEGKGKGGEGKGQPGQSEPKPDDDKKDGEGEGEGKDGEPKPDDKKKDGKGAGSGDKDKDDIKDQEQRARDQKANDKTSQNVPDNLDEILNKNNDKLGKAAGDTEGKQDRADNAIKPGDIAKIMQQKGSGGQPQKSSADSNPYDLGERVYKPKLNWKAMLKKMVPSGVEKEETITSPDRRSAAQTMVSISQTGVGRLKAGERDEQGDKKGLCFVLDNSGSTMDKVGAMQNDILLLLKGFTAQLGNDLYVMKFSNDAHFFKVDIKSKKFGRITTIEEFIKKGKAKVSCDTPITQLFQKTYGGATVLSSTITGAVKTLIAADFNVVMFSDSDIVDGANNQEQLKLIFSSGKNQVALIGCSLEDYKAYVKVLGSKPQITHL